MTSIWKAIIGTANFMLTLAGVREKPLTAYRIVPVDGFQYAVQRKGTFFWETLSEYRASAFLDWHETITFPLKTDAKVYINKLLAYEAVDRERERKRKMHICQEYEKFPA